MPAKIHRIKLSEDERHELEAIRNQKRGKDSNIMRAVALLLSDEGPRGPSMKDADVRKATGMTARTLERLRERCCQVGPLGALERKPRETPGREIKITGEVEARITQLACSKPPSDTPAGLCAFSPITWWRSRSSKPFHINRWERF